MQTSVESLEDNKVKLTISVDEDEFEPQIDEAFKRIAREVRIPGFRPGKVPRKVLEARIGTDFAREEALREALPDYYAQAVADHEVDVIAPPEIDITAGQDEGPLAFDAVVEVRPRITISGYDSLRVTIPSPVVDDEEVEHQLDHLRERFASLETVEREAIDGDHVVIDIQGTQDGEALDGLTADDYSYEVGSGGLVPELDENLRGTKAGDIVQFDAEHPDPDEDDLAFRVLVKEVQAKVLPDADDAWAAEASEFDNLADLRADLEERASKVKIVQAQMALRERTAEALGELVDDEVPPALVDGEVQNRLQDLAMRLSAQGATVEQYLEATGQDQDSVLVQLRESAEPSVRIDLALRAVAEAEGLEADERDLAEEFEAVAQRVDEEPDEVRAQLERGGQIAALRSDVKKRKALEWLVERVEIVDEDGNPVERSSLELPPDEEDESAPSDADTGSSGGEPGAETEETQPEDHEAEEEPE